MTLYKTIAEEIQRQRFVYGYEKVNTLLADLNVYDKDIDEQRRLLEVMDITLDSECELTYE